MKGYVKVDRTDLLSAIIGFEIRYDVGKDMRDKGIRLYYEKHYTNGSWFTQWWNRNKTQTDFVRSRMCAFGTWTDVIHEVLTSEECDEVDWWCWTTKSSIDSLKALYNAGGTGHDYVLVDNEMAAQITKYKEYLESVK